MERAARTSASPDPMSMPLESLIHLAAYRAVRDPNNGVPLMHWDVAAGQVRAPIIATFSITNPFPDMALRIDGLALSVRCKSPPRF